MRLINSNKFKEKLNYLNYELYNSHPVGELSEEEKDTVSWFIHHISKMVDNMPTEDAISTEWIKNWFNPKYANIVYYSLLRDMINDWKKENENR